jgi:NAD dependent epimerase/dehydratase family enzyme
MLPVLPVLVIGGTVLTGKTLAKKLRPKPNTIQVLTQGNARQSNKTSFFQRMDTRYQHFFQAHIDPLFGTQQRGQQMQEFSGAYSEKEADINRRIGRSLLTAKLALLGAVVYPICANLIP